METLYNSYTYNLEITSLLLMAIHQSQLANQVGKLLRVFMIHVFVIIINRK